MKQFDVVALGELLIDFTPGGISPAGRALYECNPGGAPANVLTAVTRQGQTAAFIGKVGEDTFGRLLAATLIEAGINTGGLCFDSGVRTTLAFVSLDQNGNRSFSFFRNPGADIMLCADEVSVPLIRSARVFHFGSLSLTHEPARSATRFALETARENGLIISYDPNLRPALWPSMETAREQILAHLPYADVVKLSDEEFSFLTGHDNVLAGAPQLAREFGISCLFITLGPKGALYCCGDLCDLMPTYDVKVVDTTGSGDAFMGTVLSGLCRMYREELAHLEESALREIVDLANGAGAIAATKKGGIPSIPTAEEIRGCMNTTPLLVG